MKSVIGILAIVAIALGYKIYDERTSSPETEVSQNNTNNNQSVEDALVSPPLPGADQKVSDAYFKLVSDNAVESGTLDISGCKFNPFVVLIKKDQNLSLVNNDPVPHTISFGDTLSHTVSAASSKIITANFGKGTGVYGFRCDNVPKPAGVISVIN